VYFRFECGEFLRASEVLTIFSDTGEPVQCFAKLYRNRHVRMQAGNDEFRHLASLTTQAEWVQVYFEDELFLEECAAEPRIERHKQGWRYNVVPDDGVAVRKGVSRLRCDWREWLVPVASQTFRIRLYFSFLRCFTKAILRS